jgi:hypothetical protein
MRLVKPASARQPFLDSGLASDQFLMCSVIHFKRLLACEDLTTTQTASDAKRQAFEVFLLINQPKKPDITLV